MRLHQSCRSFLEQRVEIDTVDQIQRVQRIALGLRHFLPILITNQAMDVDLVKWHVPHETEPEHHHPGNPEENDVEAGYQYLSWIEHFQGIGLFRPALRGERPQTG